MGMSTPTHDPPGAETPEKKVAPDLSKFEGQRFEKYARMREKLGREPMALIAEMRLRGRVRIRAGRPMVDDKGAELIALPPFREIAPRLTERTGVPVTHETVRRWWETAWPNGHPNEPTTVGVTAEEVRTAMRKARERTTNASIPPAAFVSPAGD